MKKVMNMIQVSFQREGIHHYEKALSDPDLSDVQFLGYPHRHIFHFKVAIEVFTNDREIEFIQFKRILESLYDKQVLNLDNQSCEMISDYLSEYISTKYPNRKIIIEISEDKENGSIGIYET